MEQIGKSQEYQNFFEYKLKNLEPWQLQIRILGSLQPYTDYQSRAKISAAFDLAQHVHGAVIRKDGKPYLSHPLRNAARIIDHFGLKDPELATAAILHDTVEDGPEIICDLASEIYFTEDDATAKAVEVIEDIFGERVAGIVEAVTVPGFEGNRYQRNKLYNLHTAQAIKDPDTFVIKLSDIIDNAGGLRYVPNDDFKNSKASKWDPTLDTFISHLETRTDLPFNDQLNYELREKLSRIRSVNEEFMMAA